MNVSVRKISLSDAQTVVSLAATLAAFDGKNAAAFSVADFQRYGFGENRLFDGVIAERGGIAVGYALYRDMYDIDSAHPGLHLMDLCVLEKVRRQGVGRALMHALADACTALGGTWMTWQCLQDNHSAMAFYQALGGRQFDCADFELSGPALKALTAQRV
jgi:ribosomal protein S18 acetylase RimI-like enzyme